jgi:hypothetical protein
MTKKKTLLNEGTVRQFMKLANIEPLTPGFVEKLYEGDNPYGGEKGGRQHDAPEDEHEDKDTEEEEDKADFEKPTSPKGKARRKKEKKKEKKPHLYKALQEEEEFEVEDEMEVEEEGGDDVDVAALVRAIADAVEEHTGVSVDVADEEGGEEEELGFEDEEEVDLGGGEEEVELEDEEEVELEEVISTIAENVTRRLQEMTRKKKNKLNEFDWPWEKGVSDEEGDAIGAEVATDSGAEVDVTDPANYPVDPTSASGARETAQAPQGPTRDAARAKNLVSKRMGATDWYADIAKNLKRSFPDTLQVAKLKLGGRNTRRLQKQIDSLASELGLRAGKDFKNFKQMKQAILDAMTQEVATGALDVKGGPSLSPSDMLHKQSRVDRGQSVEPIGKKI